MNEKPEKFDPVSDLPGSKSKKHNQRSKKILVIEDEPDIRENVMTILDFSGYRVLGAEDGSIGLQLVKNESPDLIICDVMMPEMNGYEFLAKLRKNPVTAAIPFIFVTAKTAREDWRTGFEIGADDYITKPFSSKELISAVKARFQRQTEVSGQGEERMNQLRGNLIRVLPQEFRTPLTEILGYSEILLESYQTMSNGLIESNLHRIHSSVENLHQITLKYLLYAQIEVIAANPAKVEELQTNYIHVIKSIILYISNQKAKEFQRKNDLIMENLEDAAVRISEGHLVKLIEELIDNAFKFSEAGTPVRISATVTEMNYIIRIANSGIGMTPGHIANVGAFMQFETKLSDRRGIGLGLIIAKRLAEIHDGSLTIESEPDRETIVEITLKRVPGK